MSLPPDDHATVRDDSDPLLLFATEPGLAAPPEPVVEIPREFVPDAPVEPPPESPPELVALRSRVETAEQSLLESKREVEVLRRQMATLVAVATDNRQAARTRRGPLAAGVAVLLAVAGMAGWRWGGTPAPLAAAPAAVEAAAASAAGATSLHRRSPPLPRPLRCRHRRLQRARGSNPSRHREQSDRGMSAPCRWMRCRPAARSSSTARAWA